MAGNEGNGRFEQMMELAEFGRKQNDGNKQIVFKMFASYVTLLVVIAWGILNFWMKAPPSKWLSGGAIVALFMMLCVYYRWLTTVYGSMIYDLRRRDFYLKKAEVICYHASEDLACEYSPCEKVSINLGSGWRYETTEKQLFKKRAPDIANCMSPAMVLCRADKPSLRKDKFFQFNLGFPLILTLLIWLMLGWIILREL